MSGDVDLRGLSATAGRPVLLIVDDDDDLRQMAPYPSSHTRTVPQVWHRDDHPPGADRTRDRAGLRGKSGRPSWCRATPNDLVRSSFMHSTTYPPGKVPDRRIIESPPAVGVEPSAAAVREFIRTIHIATNLQ
jgi:hypothetical protein